MKTILNQVVTRHTREQTVMGFQYYNLFGSELHIFGDVKDMAFERFAYAFSTLVLQSQLKSIGRHAFSYTSLCALNLSHTDIETIKKRAFYNCAKLSSVVFSSKHALPPLTISQEAFQNCTSLSSICLPPSLVHLGPLAFKRCVSLSTVDLEKTSIKTIYFCTFMECSGLRAVTVPESLTVIEERAFMDCLALQT
jgi:hypothetical protein